MYAALLDYHNLPNLTLNLAAALNPAPTLNPVPALNCAPDRNRPNQIEHF